MFRQDRILALDIGASKLTLAEFRLAKTGAPELVNYAIGPLGMDPERETDASSHIAAAIRDLMKDRGLRSAPTLMTVTGQAVIPRYQKLPPVAREKLLQIIRYEAEQNVPFPIDEVVWDYQLLDSDPETGELNVMLVAVKTDRVSGLTDCVQAAGLEPAIVDVAPMALYNAVRYNYPDLPGCTMILDIGARSSNVVFVERERVYSRSIPVAGNAITQEIAKEFEVSFQEAEDLKLEHGFVALGGVYAGPDNEVADRVSRIARTVIARLHAEVNRSINFYRSQQGGEQPRLILLAGGSSTLPHTDTFFREKVKADVQYLNPFVHMPVNGRISGEQIARDAHLLGEVTGLALRKALICPVEINLMPPRLVADKTFRRRQPFFALAAVSIALILLCWWVYFKRMQTVVHGRRATVETKLRDLEAVSARLGGAQSERDAARERAERLSALVASRTHWIEILKTVHANVPEGMWITRIEPRIEQGRVTGFVLAGKGFLDKLPDGTAIEEFRDRLIASPLFTEETRIVRLPGVPPGGFEREFEISIVLKTPVGGE